MCKRQWIRCHRHGEHAEQSDLRMSLGSGFGLNTTDYSLGCDERHLLGRFLQPCYLKRPYSEEELSKSFETGVTPIAGALVEILARRYESAGLSYSRDEHCGGRNHYQTKGGNGTSSTRPLANHPRCK
jgi:hypothetical protein